LLVEVEVRLLLVEVEVRLLLVEVRLLQRLRLRVRLRLWLRIVEPWLRLRIRLLLVDPWLAGLYLVEVDMALTYEKLYMWTDVLVVAYLGGHL
jgi:hypothetical protein